MRDRFIQEAIEASSFTFVPIRFYGFLRGTNLLMQELRIDGKLVHEVGDLFRVSQQALAPLFCLIVFAFVSIISTFHSIYLCLKRLWLNAPHQLADELHLSASSLALFGWNGSITLEGIKQVFLRKYDFLKLLFRKRGDFLAECLKCQHFSFFCTFGRNLAGVFIGRFVVVMGAFITHVHSV